MKKGNLGNFFHHLILDYIQSKVFCKTSSHKDSDRILSNDDMTKLIATLHQKQSEDDLYIQNYAIELATMSGMRVGEIAALKWECVTQMYETYSKVA